MRQIVATATDANYVELAGVMLRSLTLNELPEGVEIVVLSDGLKETHKADLKLCTGGRDIKFLDLLKEDISTIDHLTTNSNWSRTIYARLLLPQLLKLQAGRIVYLDADTLVIDSIYPLFNLDLAGQAIAAVGGNDSAEAARLGLNDGTATFNSGVLVVDPERWLASEIGTKAIALATQRSAQGLPSYDQDVLNIILSGQFLCLDNRWNYAGYAAISNPAILHFIHAKPNTTLCKHPMRELYFSYRNETPWAGKRLRNRWDKRWRRLVFSLRSRLRRMRGGKRQS
ncbi:glycosyltransferase family 8 protein [Rhizobium sullae]|uniref:Lipopolysaccharide biosynthesis glycosyltransferase n=1 Tax=Rhizobium sullae TaxID=50338 RepID=A0A4R3QDA4_RHISU|nr:glycosyltransferase [Rhizobium sullae]TCU17552.1 lipopolysaccharide biosynthesis glycosyltransferase [Rhizobium sullae]